MHLHYQLRTWQALPWRACQLERNVNIHRLILPQPTVANILDAIIACKIHPLLVRSPIYVAGRPRIQALEIAHACQLAAEKALDYENQGCQLQADVAAFYDNLSVLETTDWLGEPGACFLDCYNTETPACHVGSHTYRVDAHESKLCSSQHSQRMSYWQQNRWCSGQTTN